MSAERDLLRRAKCLLECSNMEPLQRQTDLIVEGIKELLAQPEQAVAECTNSDTWNCKYCNKTESCGALKDSRNFAPPNRKPLSDEEIYSIGNKYAFHAAVREIERIHGIGI